MTQPEEAVGGTSNDDPIVAAEPTIEDRFAAIVDEDEGEEVPAPETQTDEPELEADDLDDEDVPPIHPPTSWPDEDKAAFADLPRALQERVTAREAEREKFVQAKSREASTARTQAEQQAVAYIKQQNEMHAQQLVSLLPDIPEEPSAHLLTQDPNAYAEAIDYRNWALREHHRASQTIQQLATQQQQLDQYQGTQAMQASVELLAQEFPEFLDGTTRPELVKKITSTGIALGFSQDQLNSVDGAEVLALRKASEWKDKADRYDSLMAKRMDKVREAKTLPRVSRPGAAQPRGAAANQRYEADRQAMKAGDKDAAVRVFSRFV